MMSENIMNKKMKGFTLIELMIVVVIVGILAAVAYPSYQDSVRKSRRADAQGVLMGLAGAMERHYTNNNTYKGAGPSGADTGAPAIYAKKSPKDGTNTYYELTIKAATANTYSLKADAKGPQLSDKCGFLTLEHTGVKGHEKGSNCW